MERTRNIEFLSVLFTAGIAAGMLIPPSSAALIAGALLPCLAISVLGRERIAMLPERAAAGWIFGTFLLLGAFCCAAARIPAAHGPDFIGLLAEDCAAALRAFIRSLPFRDEGTAPLLLALLTGDRSALPAHTTAVFRESGASHLLALSGLHIGIIYLVADRIARVMGRSRTARRLRYGIIVSGAGFFTLMTGAGPSIMRAFLFILIGETLRLLGRPRNAVRVLCLALFVQLVLDPEAIGELGFQLSYLAMAGIFLLYPVLEKWYPEGSARNPLRRIWQAAALSISCQVFTGPLAWYRFHTFPRFFLLTNLFAIPLTTCLMVTAVLTVALSAIGVCPAALIQATDLLCRALTEVLGLIASM